MSVICLGILIVMAAAASAAPAASSASSDRVLVQLAAGASAQDVARAVGAQLVAEDPQARVALLLGADADKLRRHAAVVDVEADGRVRAQTARWDTARWDTARWDTARWDTARWDGSDDGAYITATTWGLAAIRAPTAWSHGVPEHTRIVCLVDSGIDQQHPRLAPNLWRDADGAVGVDFVDGDRTPEDRAGHGTHLAGIIASTAVAGDRFRGVAAPLVASAKVLGDDGTGRTSDVVAALAWCRGIGADVVVLALTEDTPTRALRHSLREASLAGLLVVASAGNAGPCERCVSYPAAYPEVLAVAAIGPEGALASFSSHGPQVDLVAPGEGIHSTFPGGGFRVGSGTSQSTAYAAGAAALLWAQQPSWDARQVIRALLDTATPLDGVGAPASSGKGRLDVGAATGAG